MLPKMLAMLPAFLAYFAVAIALIAVFFLVYVNVTPYDEIALIRQGNTAAAVGLSGALFGFAIPWPMSSPTATRWPTSRPGAPLPA